MFEKIFESEYKRDDFKIFLEWFLPDFKYRLEQYSEKSSVKILGKCPNLEGGFQVFEIDKNDASLVAKSTLSDEIFNMMDKRLCKRALAVFYNDKGEWRFSLLEIDVYTKEKSDKKRYSFLVGKDTKVKTAERMFLSESEEYGKIKKRKRGDEDFTEWDDLKYRFSKEVLSKEFFKELYDWYLWAVQTTKYPNGTVKNNNSSEKYVETYIDYGKDREKLKEHIIRLITRLMFIWFIKQKPIELIPDDFFTENKLNDILNDFEENNSTYYHGILQNLFFATLNRPIVDEDTKENLRGWANNGKKSQNEFYGIKNLFRDNINNSLFKDKQKVENLFNKVPYLNGGLFECLDDFDEQDESAVFYRDGFSRVPERRPTVPNYLFFSEKPKSVLLKEYIYNKKENEWQSEKKEIQGIINIFEKYNWTIDENTDEDVALDPELLGKVFEKLLGTYDPMTSEMARKNSGSFYTPKWVVDYMVEESLNEYLKDKKDKVEALKLIKILDPACGSGAFPYGILNGIIKILKQQDRDLENDKERLYREKLHFIENCIYGVDILPIAVQITKLRFFISLICEQKPTDNAEDNFGIKVLPSLETKFVCADSLIDLSFSMPNESFLLECKKELYNLRRKIVKADTFKKKMSLREKDRKLCKDILNHYSRDIFRNFLIESYKKEIEELKPDTELPENYQEQQRQGNLFYNDRAENIFQIDVNKAKRDYANERIKFLKTLIKRIESGDNADAESNFKKIISWDPYNQNKKADVFNAEWMFGFKDGFDIVIGNPPYVRQERLGQEYKEKLALQFPIIANGVADLYVYFYGAGLKSLKKEGVLIYITLNKYLKTKYGLELRNELAKNYDVDEIIDFFELPVFEASTDTSITKILNRGPISETKYFPVKILEGLDLNRLKKGTYQKVIKDDNEWKVIDNSSEENILEKIYDNTIVLKEFVNNKIYRGITTGANKVFILDKEISSKLLNSESRDLIKPYAESTDIQKYNLKDKYKYFLATGYDINVKSKYPTAYKYLKQFEDKLKDRQDKGANWWNLRACAYYPDFESPKLIYIHTAVKHQFYFDNEGRYINNSCYMIISDSKFLFAFLNSKLFEWFKKIKFVAYGDAKGKGRAKLDYNKMVTVPIKKISLEQQQPIINLVNKNLKNHSIDAKIEWKINFLIYKLYNLSYKEMKIIDPDIFSITNVEQEQQPIMEKINQIFSKIEEQDSEAEVRTLERDIDELVYGLYGLTEEEIKVVEGKIEK